MCTHLLLSENVTICGMRTESSHVTTNVELMTCEKCVVSLDSHARLFRAIGYTDRFETLTLWEKTKIRKGVFAVLSNFASWTAEKD